MYGGALGALPFCTEVRKLEGEVLLCSAGEKISEGGVAVVEDAPELGGDE